MYLELGSLLPVVQELNRRGWSTKRWTTKKQTERGGVPFTKNRLYHLLTNVTYAGKIAYKAEIHEGEHEAIIDAATFERVQQVLNENGRSGCADKRNKHGAVLRGLLRCAACDCGMTHTYTKKGNRLYRYYVCNHAQQHGRKTCPAPSVPAGEIERFVVDEIRAIGRDPALVAATWAQSRRLADEAIGRLKRERAALERQRRADEAELRELVAKPDQNGELAKLAQVQERSAATERRLAEVGDDVSRWTNHDVSESDVSHALAEFDSLWAALTPCKQVQVLTLLIEQVDFDGQHCNIDITFRPTGIKTLACGVAQHEETAA